MTVIEAICDLCGEDKWIRSSDFCAICGDKQCMTSHANARLQKKLNHIHRLNIWIGTRHEKSI